MISIADHFGFLTLAKGIENEHQTDWLREHGCSYGQGYHLGLPAPWEAMQARLKGEPLH